MTHTDLLYSFALNKLTANRERLNSLLEEQKGTDIGRFMERALEWRTEASKRQLLWELFHEVIDMSDMGFMGSFIGFVVNALLDDAAFRVEWRKAFLDENKRLVWLSGGDFKTVLTDKDDPKAEPVIVLDCHEGTQDVPLLMEAMDHKEWEVLQRQELENKKNELLAKMRNNLFTSK
jgi:hypothetical protein